MSTATTRLRRVGVGGLAALVAFGGVALTSTSASADWAATGGEIGLVDTALPTAPTNGSTLVFPGATKAPIGDVQLLIPNVFKNNDTIDLQLLDRSETATAGNQCADATQNFGFDTAPTVTVSGPYAAASTIGTTGGTVPTAAAGLNLVTDPTLTGTTTPVFSVSLVSSPRCAGAATDIVRLTQTGVQASGNATAKFLVTVKGATVKVGSKQTPGAVKLVPFAYNGSPASTAPDATGLFGGNLPDDPSAAGYAPTIKLYTVPTYVSPVTFGLGTPNRIVADGTAQKFGDFTINEVQPYALQAGTYTITVAGATIWNTTAAHAADATVPLPTVTKSGSATAETVALGAVGANSVAFTLAGAIDNTTPVTIKVSGLYLGTGTAGPLTFTLSGGSVASGPATWLASPAGSGVALAGVPAEMAGVNQKDIVAPSETASAFAGAVTNRIGGANRYETAAKIAANVDVPTDWAIIASGKNFPDALAANFLAGAIDNVATGEDVPILLADTTLPDATAQALRTMCVKHVYIVGGPVAVSSAVETQLRDRLVYDCGTSTPVVTGEKLDVTRVGGADRYETARKITQAGAAIYGTIGRTQIKFGEPSKRTALLATGLNYPDALAAGPIAYDEYFPLVLTGSGALNAQAKAALTSLGIQQVVILGETDVVSAAVETELQGLGMSTYRLGGATRFETANAVATWATTPAPTPLADGGLNWDPSTVYLATGRNFPDALAGGPLQELILLTEPSALPTSVSAWLTAHAADVDRVVALGLTGAVSDAALDAANDAAAAS